MVMVIIVAAIVSAMAPRVDIVAVVMVIIAAKDDDIRRGRANDSDAATAMHVAYTTG
jgi:hypothetical protein